jgi:hypothetical protein
MPIINVNHACLECLDLTPARIVLDRFLAQSWEAIAPDPITFQIMYARQVGDPRELSEIPEVRLWFVRLDAHYPMLAYLVDWRSELSRYGAMLVPHQFSTVEGLIYNPEAMELFVMGKLFYIWHWLGDRGARNPEKLQQWALALGYEVDTALFSVLT